MDKDALLRYGIDYDNGLKNCMGKIDFYKKIMGMFLIDPCFSKAKSACEAHDQKELFLRLHELKGTSGSTALTDLSAAVSPLVELLRAGDVDFSDVEPLFHVIEAAYTRACEGIELIIADK